MGVKLVQPKFWGKPNVLTKILYPLSRLYGGLVSFVMAQQKPHKLPIKSLCVGNLMMGGAGKTPICIAIAELLRAQNINAHIVFKAYQSTVKQTVFVNDSPLKPQDIGDEPLMVSQKGIPTWTGPARFDAAMMAYKSGAELVIFDDGFQDLRVHTDVRGLIFEPSLTNSHVFPAGPLREPLNKALQRADALFVDDKYSTYDLPQSKEIIYYKRLIECDPGFIKESPSLAFCGIGNPNQFEEMLKQNNFNVVDFIVFPDHYKYRIQDMDYIFNRAKLKKLQIIATEKDSVKIPKNYACQINIIKLKVQFLDPKKILSWVVKSSKKLK
jgi:tetraacyldisaccharide 4'-kinase